MADTTFELSGTQSSQNLQRPQRSIAWDRVFIYLVLGLGVILAIGPFAWMLSASFMNSTEVTLGRLLPGQILIENYEIAWGRANFALYTWNSIRITLISIAGTLLLSVPAAYAFARMKFVGKNILFTVMLSTMMIPEIVTLIPNFVTVVWLGRLGETVCGDACKWLDNWPALTVPFMASAFSIFLLRQFFMQIPEDLWDAAQIDGAGHVTFLRQVVLPLSKAPIMTVTTFSFIGSWNALLWPLLVVQSNNWKPVAVGLSQFVNLEANNEIHLQMAASVLMTLPILLLYFFTQRQFTEGIAASGLKG